APFGLEQPPGYRDGCRRYRCEHRRFSGRPLNGRMHRRALLEGAYRAAVEACKRPEAIIAALPPHPAGRVLVIAAGKGAVPMAQTVEAHWPDARGLAVTRTGYGGPLKAIELIEARHPVPDEAGARAAARCLALAEEAREGDLLLVLLSGGASALLAAPAPRSEEHTSELQSRE